MSSYYNGKKILGVVVQTGGATNLNNLEDGKGAGSLIQKQGGVRNSEGIVDKENIATGINATSLGTACEAHGDATLTAGRKAKAYQIGAVAFGSCTTGDADKWQAVLDTIAQVTAANPQNEGETTEEYIQRVYSLLDDTTLYNRYSFGFSAGEGNVNKGRSAGSVGAGNTNKGKYAWQSGYYNTNNEKGETAFIHGVKNINNAIRAIILGGLNETTEDANEPIILGNENISKAYLTILIGQHLLSEHYRATLIGEGLKSHANYQLLLGQYNAETLASIVFGGGTHDGNRKNLLEVFDSGKFLTPNTDLDDNDNDGYLVPKGYLNRVLNVTDFQKIMEYTTKYPLGYSCKTFAEVVTAIADKIATAKVVLNVTSSGTGYTINGYGYSITGQEKWGDGYYHLRVGTYKITVSRSDYATKTVSVTITEADTKASEKVVNIALTHSNDNYTENVNL